MLFLKLLSTHTHTMYFYIFFNLILYKIVNNHVVTGIQDLDTIVMNNDESCVPFIFFINPRCYDCCRL